MDDRSKVLAVIAALIILISGIAVAVSLTHSDQDGGITIGVTWRPNGSAESYVNTFRSIEAAGAIPVRLGQVFTDDLSYDGSGKLLEGIDENGALDSRAADVVKEVTWHNSNVEEMMDGIDFVVFPGGDDISYNLYRNPQEWGGTEEDKVFEPERDVSDYICMTYCLDKDIPLVAVCRGMQMLAVVSGAEMIQDIPEYFEEHLAEYHYEHRNQRSSPDAYRDYASHDVTIDKGSRIYEVMGTETVSKVPSWHHQAVLDVKGTPLKVTGRTYTDGIGIIESLERTDKTCAFGIQYHPEAAVVKHLDDYPNRYDYMDYQSAIALFEWIVNYRE
jgi:putative glutamine amidotransferase